MASLCGVIPLPFIGAWNEIPELLHAEAGMGGWVGTNEVSTTTLATPIAQF